MAESNSPPRVFLSYAHEDQKQVEALYHQLASAGFKPWMDIKDILPGEVWMESIRSAIENSDFFLACLSPNSVLKRGVLQKEFKSALDIWQGMLDSDIYFIPVRLENCAVPNSLTRFQWVDLFEADGFSKLEKALKKGMGQRNGNVTLEIPKPGGKERGEDRQTPTSIVRAALRPRRQNPVQFWGSVTGVVAAIALLPVIFNNYIYRVRRPVLPNTCQVSTEPVRVGLSRLANCSSAFQDQLAASWMGDAIETSIIPQSFATGDAARQQSGYDLVVWGACDGATDNTAHLTFELITSRKPYEVYEPPSLDVSASLNDLSSVGLALINYQHGNYAEATKRFEALPKSIVSTVLSLFQSNSHLFAERYTAAITSFEEVSKAGDAMAAAAYNNMGIAYFNQDTNLGLDQFDEAIRLAEKQNSAEIEALALVNRSEYYRFHTTWKSALNDCSAALALNGQSALPYLCLTSYYIMHYRYGPAIGPLPFPEIDRDLNEAVKYQNAPPAIHYIRGYWYLNHFWKRKQDAVSAFTAYLAEMNNKACLQTDRTIIADAVDIIQANTSP